MPDLSDVVNWSEVDANNNQAPPNGWPEGMMPSTVNDAARADRGALKRFWNKINAVQTITPSGGVYTFTTGNTAYPTAYVGGEIYSFRPGASSIGGDQFRVNALPAKSILKDVGGWVPIMAQDIVGSVPVQLLYDAVGDTFVLLNPHLPISGDGSGTGVSVPGGFTVGAGDLVLSRTDQAYGWIVRPNVAGFNNLCFGAAGGAYLNDLTVYTNTMHVFGQLSANGYQSRAGLNGPNTGNAFNIQWTSTGAHLWIDVTDEGPIVTAPGGNMTLNGTLSVAGSSYLSATNINGTLSVAGSSYLGATNINGNLNVTGSSSLGPLNAGNVTASYVTANGMNVATGDLYVSNGALHVTGSAAFSSTGYFSGNLGTGGNLTANYVTATAGITANGNVTANAGVTVNAGGVNIVGGGIYVANASSTGSDFNIGGNSTITGIVQANAGGTALYAPNGNLNVGGVLQFQGLQLSSLSGTPNWVFSGGNGYYTNYAMEAANSGTAFYAPNGGVVCVTCSATSFINTSDAALKTDIAPSTIGLDAILQLVPKTFRWIATPEKEQLGLIAQEVEVILPQALAIAEGGDLHEPLLGINYAIVTTALVRAVQQLYDMIKNLEEDGHARE